MGISFIHSNWGSDSARTPLEGAPYLLRGLIMSLRMEMRNDTVAARRFFFLIFLFPPLYCVHICIIYLWCGLEVFSFRLCRFKKKIVLPLKKSMGLKGLASSSIFICFYSLFFITAPLLRQRAASEVKSSKQGCIVLKE